MSSSARFGLRGHFDAAHHLVGAGICEQPHGHTYLVEALWRDPGNDRVEQGGEALRRVLQAFDHRDLNSLMSFPSCENLAARLAQDLGRALPGLVSVTVQEGLGGWARADAEAP